MGAIMAATNDCSTLEDLLEKACKMFHPSHYLPTLTRIKLNTAFLKLGARNEGNAEVEILMRRKEFLDEVHQVRYCSRSNSLEKLFMNIQLLNIVFSGYRNH